MAKVNFTPSTKEDKATHKVELLIRLVVGKDAVIRAKSGYFVDKKWLKQLTRNERIKGSDGKYLKDQYDNYVTRSVPMDNWRIKTSNNAEQRTAQTNLARLEADIINLCNSTPNQLITKEWLEKVIYKHHNPNEVEVEVKPNFFDIFDRFLQVHPLSDVRKRNFAVIYRALQRYQLWRNVTLEYDTFTDAVLIDFKDFLLTEHSHFTKGDDGKYICAEEYKHIIEAYPETRTPQPRGQNTINDIMRKLRTLFIWCNNNEITTTNPFRHYKIDECKYGTPYYITIEERNHLYDADLSARPALAVQRDIFVFQCLIGCRIGDLYNLTRNDIVEGEIDKSQRFISYVARKTKDSEPVTVRVPLHPIAQEIIDRYASNERKELLPYISEQRYNDAIKEAFTEAGITRKVAVLDPLTRISTPTPINEVASSHLARRCFVGNLYKQVKDPNLVGALSGHRKGSTAFYRYNNVDDEMRNELINLL